MPLKPSDPLDLHTVAARCHSGEWDPAAVAATSLDRIERSGSPEAWIHRLTPQQVMEQVERARSRKREGEELPLYGVPFAVKDNIDVEGVPTTAACPEFRYLPEKSAAVVSRLCDAGAIVLGKTNLDQFATGLVGVRSPFGVCRNVFDARYISGGSSSGSAVVVAEGQVSFALGTDTAGSGRVPAAFGNIVGLKPTRGLMSTAGVVPACRSFDCVSVFTLTCEDACAVAKVATAFDASDPYSRRASDFAPPAENNGAFRFGVPDGDQLKFFGNSQFESIYHAAIERLRGLGGTPVTIDFEPFVRAGRQLYGGPWVAQRLEAAGELLQGKPQTLLPVIRNLLEAANQFSATDAYEAGHELRRLIRLAEDQWKCMDLMVIPTAGTIYKIGEIEADPIGLNSNLGYYTNFANLMDMCAVAVPAGFGADGLPAGISLVAPAGADAMVLKVGARFQRSCGKSPGATGRPLPARPSCPPPPPIEHAVALAVVGAHLSGQPLNHQLIQRQARLVHTCRTAPNYRLFALPGTKPPKPGLIRDSSGGGAIEVEVWEMTEQAFGSFVAAIPPPLGVGTIELEDSTRVKGFLCEEYATDGAREITSLGGWRAYLATAEQRT